MTPHLVWVFPGFGVGGAQVRFCALANWLGTAGRHSVVALNGDIACREKLDPSLDVRFPVARHRPGKMVDSTWHARAFLRAQKPDLVVTSNWGAIEWAVGARLAGLRHLHTEDGFGPEERSSQIRRRVLTRRLVLRGSDVVLPSQTLLASARDVWQLPARRLHYIPNGIDLARFSGAAPAPLPPGEGPVIGTVAALRPEKNIARLLRAFALLHAQHPARLVIVGDGPERAGLEDLTRELGLGSDVVFAGHSTEPNGWLAAMDVFILSSDTEQMPISLLEAMASGLPVVSTDVGDVRHMLSQANAPFVVAQDDRAMADALGALLRADRRAIGAANRKKAVRDYDQETMFAAHARVLGRLPCEPVTPTPTLPTRGREKH